MFPLVWLRGKGKHQNRQAERWGFVWTNTGQWICLQLDDPYDFSAKPQTKFICVSSRSFINRVTNSPAAVRWITSTSHWLLYELFWPAWETMGLKPHEGTAQQPSWKYTCRNTRTLCRKDDTHTHTHVHTHKQNLQNSASLDRTYFPMLMEELLSFTSWVSPPSHIFG